MFGFLAQLLAWCYKLVPNYGVAITLFTLIVMVAVTPFTIKGMRSMAEMARLQPQMKRLQDQYKNDRVKMNEEMQALFKEHKVNPLGGCLPTLLPLPIFFIIFRLLRGLNGKYSYHLFSPKRALNGLPNPHYLPHSSSLYQSLVSSGGKMVSFGMDLGKAARDHHASASAALPFYGLIAVMTVSQYVMQQQMNKRNPQAANANPQMKLTMQLFPAFYAVISLTIPASVVLYLLVSGLYRMVQNLLSYKYDPKLALPPLADTGAIDATSRPSPGGDAKAGSRAALTKGAPAGKGKAAATRAPGSAKGKAGATVKTTASRPGGADQTGTNGGFLARARAALAAASGAPSRPEPQDAPEDAPATPVARGKTRGSGATRRPDAVDSDAVDSDAVDSDAVDSDVPGSSRTTGGTAKRAINVKPGGSRPTSGRVTPRGNTNGRSRRGR
jgi:YidC/Oxa1 family membrane protein insertase